MKKTMYQIKAKPKKPTVTVKLGQQEHAVVSPQQMQQQQRDMEQMKREIQQLQQELSTLRNAVRQLANKPPPSAPSAAEFWNGIR